MKTYSIPVDWSVWDKVEVEAESPLEAIKWLQENIDAIPLTVFPEYIDGSFKIGAENTEPEKILEELAEYGLIEEC